MKKKMITFVAISALLAQSSGIYAMQRARQAWEGSRAQQAWQATGGKYIGAPLAGGATAARDWLGPFLTEVGTALSHGEFQQAIQIVQKYKAQAGVVGAALFAAVSALIYTMRRGKQPAPRVGAGIPTVPAPEYGQIPASLRGLPVSDQVKFVLRDVALFNPSAEEIYFLQTLFEGKSRPLSALVRTYKLNPASIKAWPNLAKVLQAAKAVAKFNPGTSDIVIEVEKLAQ